MSQFLVYSNATNDVPSKKRPWAHVYLNYPTTVLNRKLIDASGIENKYTIFNLDTSFVVERSEHEFFLSIVVFGFGFSVMRQWGY